METQNVQTPTATEKGSALLGGGIAAVAGPIAALSSTDLFGGDGFFGGFVAGASGCMIASGMLMIGFGLRQLRRGDDLGSD